MQILIRIPDVNGKEAIKTINDYLRQKWKIVSISTGSDFKDYILKDS